MESTEAGVKQDYSDRPEIEQIDVFKMGYAGVTDQVVSFASTCRQLLGSHFVTSEVRTHLQAIGGELDKSLALVQDISRKLPLQLNSSDLERDGFRDYHNFFTEQINDHRVSFIVFLKTYAILKSYNLEISDLWYKIKGTLENSGVPKNSDFMRQFLSYRLVPAMRINEVIRVYCSRMTLILGMESEPGSFKDLHKMGVYNENMNYQLSTVFTPNLREQCERILQTSPPKNETNQADISNVKISGGDTGVNARVPESETYLNSSGNMPWNKGAFYIFSYDLEKLALERKGFRQVIHIDIHMGADSQMIRGSIIRKFTSKKEAESPEAIEQKYNDFLFSYFDLVIQISMLNLSIKLENKNLFLYHLGPQFFFHLTRRFLQEAKTGMLHRKSGSVIKKYIPQELLKKNIMEFWRGNILKSVGEEKNDFLQFREIVGQVSRAHAGLAKDAVKKYNNLPEDRRRNKVRADLFRDNLNDWFGATNVIVFKRFLKSVAF